MDRPAPPTVHALREGGAVDVEGAASPLDAGGGASVVAEPPPTVEGIRVALAQISAGLGHAIAPGTALAPELRLVEDLHLDSVGLLTLAVEVEDRFRICLDPEDEAAIRTVGDLERVLRGKLGR
jgi:acyl carrier protein